MCYSAVDDRYIITVMYAILLLAGERVLGFVWGFFALYDGLKLTDFSETKQMGLFDV